MLELFDRKYKRKKKKKQKNGEKVMKMNDFIFIFFKEKSIKLATEISYVVVPGYCEFFSFSLYSLEIQNIYKLPTKKL